MNERFIWVVFCVWGIWGDWLIFFISLSWGATCLDGDVWSWNVFVGVGYFFEFNFIVFICWDIWVFWSGYFNFRVPVMMGIIYYFFRG